MHTLGEKRIIARLIFLVNEHPKNKSHIANTLTLRITEKSPQNE